MQYKKSISINQDRLKHAEKKHLDWIEKFTGDRDVNPFSFRKFEDIITKLSRFENNNSPILKNKKIQDVPKKYKICTHAMRV
jgi:hypothetical protein